ncbi:cobalt ECF transporter T component CbiQ [Paludicola sp. MB14-C6]|uniref:cobalt ECF transporter T component CbiQ n=1 Tax=Paludihabitans sp. MB14-C6 TaxID=3070656 RepID=UPI0027DCB661|nr:cobalt ECF transporter T component CbiQ [Paludicola sp. MB14-C6]WMJ22028.1 cobalt ECF transporter T component CbiQ [Paludicola sp. MB14-C6]
MIKIDSYAYSSKLSKELPKSKLLFGCIPLMICLFANSFLANIVTIILMGLISVKYTQIGFRKYLNLMLIPFAFLIIGTLSIIISKHSIGHRVLLGFQLQNSVYGIDYTSLMYGLNLILKALAAVSCMYFISLNTPMTDILAALEKLKIPKLMISLMELIYNYIFILLDEAAKMKIAQSSRLGYIDFKTSVKSTGELIARLFLRTYMRCDRIYSALESRGYTGEFKTLEKTYGNQKKLMLFSILNGVILIAISFIERRFIL